MACCGLTILWGQQFPLRVQDLSMGEAMASPGGYGAYGSVSAIKPAELKRLPTCKSKNPLFSSITRQAAGPARAEAGMLFLLDESGGTGRGYDRLIVDLNGNRDLTDDPVWERSPETVAQGGGPFERPRFGPVMMPESRRVGGWRPQFYVEAYLYNLEVLKQGDGEMLRFVGQMRLRAGNRLVADVEVGGIKQRVGVMDTDVSFGMGNSASAVEVSRSPGRTGWYLMPADYLLRDWDGSGEFADTVEREEAEPFSSLVHFAGRPYDLKLADDLSWIRFDAVSAATGELEVGRDVRRIMLGRQVADGWEALSPAVVDGRLTLPTGEYRIATLLLESSDAKRIRLMSSDVPLKAIEVAGGKMAKVEVGMPFRLELTAHTRSAQPGEVPGVLGAIRGMFGGARGAEEMILQLGVNVLGRGGEVYSGFSAVSGGHLAPPRFEILADGKVVGSGDFEYG
jgi:hypothetical protein